MDEVTGLRVWGRDCIGDSVFKTGCHSYMFHDKTAIELCVCEEDLCNKEMEPITETTSTSTTPLGTKYTFDCRHTCFTFKCYTPVTKSLIF